MSSLIFWILTLNPLYHFKYFLLFHRLPFHLVNCFLLLCRSFLVWHSPNLFIFAFVIMFLVSYPNKKSLSRPTSRSLPPMFSSWSFMASYFTFKPFWVAVNTRREMTNFILLHVAVLFSNIIYWTDYPLPITHFWLLCHKLIHNIYAWVYSWLSLLFHWFMCLFLCQYHTLFITTAL